MIFAHLIDIQLYRKHTIFRCWGSLSCSLLECKNCFEFRSLQYTQYNRQIHIKCRANFIEHKWEAQPIYNLSCRHHTILLLHYNQCKEYFQEHINQLYPEYIQAYIIYKFIYQNHIVCMCQKCNCYYPNEILFHIGHIFHWRSDNFQEGIHFT